MRFPGWIILLCFGAGSASAAGACVTSTELSVGQAVEMSWSGSWSPGKLVAVSMLNPATPYLVRDVNGDEGWYAVADVRPAAPDETVSAGSRPDYAFGLWHVVSADVGAAPSAAKGPQPATKALSIRADGTFTWADGNERMDGRWEEGARDPGTLVLHRGLAALEWAVTSDGRDPEGRAVLRLASSDGQVLRALLGGC